MILTKSNILIVSIILLCFSFALCELQGEYFLSSISKSFIVPLFTLLYFLNVQNKSPYFSWFLILFSISELMVFAEFYIDSEKAFDVYYMFGNLLYIIAYILLLIEVCKSLNFKSVLKNYKAHLVVLSILNIYMVYVLITIVDPFLFNNSFMIGIELTYNIVMLLLLTFSLIAYFYNDNKKSLALFLGSLSIVFSEVVQIAYFYIADKDLLNFISTVLFVLAFSFYYYHSRIKIEQGFRAIS
ncbi:hypothetical protein [Xanthomarina spongicola]|jgi:hypothetical protein|uniref:YhhN-like protein n=1 Tax=Xanthomarina spongicola TaxID=570520 RepID=A0A316DN59_9FLAO|nr:hypothetical protein [Xanthomarina spongicola]PWK19501.1 hypothetical protein LX78_00848 [Xanthomarina spongicola]